MEPVMELAQAKTRREFLRTSGFSLGSIALASMQQGQAVAAGSAHPMAPRKPHFAAKAKNVIYLHMSGAPP